MIYHIERSAKPSDSDKLKGFNNVQIKPDLKKELMELDDDTMEDLDISDKKIIKKNKASKYNPY